jgi:type I restriction enzyme S subunit
VRWGEVINIVSARRVHQSDWKSEGIPFYRAREIAKLAEDGYVDNELYISQDLFDEFSKSGVPQPGDLMVTAVGTLGKTYIVKPEDHFYYKDASVICFENYSSIVPEYLKFVMKSEMMMNQIRSNSSGTTVATLTMIRMVEYLLPLPPLAEQKRIVSKLEEILPLCEKLKK